MRKLTSIILTIMCLSFFGCTNPVTFKDTSNGNLVNRGITARDQENIYFSDVHSGAIYSMKNDGTEFKKIQSKAAEYINIQDGWIYFVTGNFIFKQKSDENEPVPVVESGDKIDWMKVSDDSIYFLNGNSLKKSGLDGKNIKVLFTDDNISSVNLATNKIYYVIKDELNQKSSICFYDLEQKNKQIVKEDIKGTILALVLQNSNLYYLVIANSGNIQSIIYSLNINDGKLRKLYTSDLNLNSFNLFKQWIYYVKEDNKDGKVIGRLNIITGNEENLDSRNTYSINNNHFVKSSLKANFNLPSDINVIGNWTFFNDINGKEYSIKAIKLK